MTAREVLARTDLAALLTELTGPPVGSGSRARWHCCDANHTDEHPSVSMFVDRAGIERWRCWSGGHAGTAIDALIANRHLSTADAITQLEQRTGHALAAVPPARRPPGPTPACRPFSQAAHQYAVACAELLWTPAGANARDWLHGRGLTDPVLTANQVGYDPGPARLARDPGLPYAGGVTYPSFNPTGTMVYVQTRHLHPGTPRKYSNPTAAHGDIPAATFPIALEAAVASGVVIVTEGVPDGLIAVTAGFRAATVLSASLATVRSADHIAGYAAGAVVYLALDNDPAGRAAQHLLRRHLHGHVTVHTLQLAEGCDLTDTYTTRNPPCPAPPNNSSSVSIT